MSQTAVIVVDFQADFTEFRNGSLAVASTGLDYVDLVIKETKKFKDLSLPIIATRDYHPPEHVSFYTNHPGKKVFDVVSVNAREQVLWPPHCVQGTPGVAILLPIDLIDHTITTADKPEFEGYSAFQDDGGRDTGLAALLNKLEATRLLVYGLAIDYCVKATVLHAVELGYEAVLLRRLSRGITPLGEQKAIKEMRSAGALIED